MMKASRTIKSYLDYWTRGDIWGQVLVWWLDQRQDLLDRLYT